MEQLFIRVMAALTIIVPLAWLGFIVWAIYTLVTWITS